METWRGAWWLMVGVLCTLTTANVVLSINVLVRYPWAAQGIAAVALAPLPFVALATLVISTHEGIPSVHKLGWRLFGWKTVVLIDRAMGRELRWLRHEHDRYYIRRWPSIKSSDVSLNNGGTFSPPNNFIAPDEWQPAPWHVGWMMWPVIRDRELYAVVEGA